ncbi:hypothetical protein EF888_06655 [Silicimonas algicola]|uniref:Uncharacterized protein n=1 Tax=Silicimonas algicola TaxID=1826607 RepID=A0A316G5L7_9RHOB|nr:hypothetical protein [Silicimonas algicola]AZQ66846.1 hypothetical protein EF888_06655 [Silicimonas algicola]PWK55246.1 hypothetical protein C8D95_108125 [Silicimonas algicola]
MKQAFHNSSTTIITAVALTIAPLPLLAGGYGAAGVSDANVGQQSAQGSQVYCERLDASVPEDLYAQMDCGPSGVARSAVAPERITNGGIAGFLSGLFRPAPAESDSPRGQRTVSRDDNDSGPNPNPGPKPTPPDETTSVAKWERLEQLGVTRGNLSEQPKEFREQVMEYRSTHGAQGDWSGFDPE